MCVPVPRGHHRGTPWPRDRWVEKEPSCDERGLCCKIMRVDRRRKLMARGKTRVLSLNNYVGSITRGEADDLERYVRRALVYAVFS